MSFTAWYYPFFLAIVVAAYWRLPHRARLWLLLAASYVFYGAWDVRFLSLIMASTLSDFFAGTAIAGERRPLAHVAAAAALPVLAFALAHSLQIVPGELPGAFFAIAAAVAVAFVAAYGWLWRLDEARRRKGFLLLSIVANLGTLFFFKYLGFFVDNAKRLLTAAGLGGDFTVVEVLLPVGISFYTFQSISYIVDVYRRQVTPSGDLLTFATYIAFFPQLVAGPIERAGHLLTQLQQPARFSPEHLHEGARLLLIGYFKKVFVANNCALVADYVFSTPGTLDGTWILLGAIAFAAQIYGDFSGYTDIARGSARLVGIDLMHNFRFPYLATGPSDFWRRWHISLSSWIRDYVYIPLGGNRGGTAASIRNAYITMVLAGLWHGATWMFALWGFYHATLLALYRVVPALGRLQDGGPRAVAVPLMFVFTLLGWLMFRSPDLDTFLACIAALGHWTAPTMKAAGGAAAWLAIHVGPLLVLQYITRRQQDEAALDHRPPLLRGLDYTVLFLLVATTAVVDVEFIYFQF
jgi:alginate O-acetyltransferase complex protein AlgI